VTTATCLGRRLRWHDRERRLSWRWGKSYGPSSCFGGLNPSNPQADRWPGKNPYLPL